MIISLLFSSLLFSQSFNEKPEVPVFNINGQNVVRVDCWEGKNPMFSQYLHQTEHPQIFAAEFDLHIYSKMGLEVSLLRSENTLTMTKYVDNEAQFQVETYGTECGFKTFDETVYCSIFEGEIFENWVIRTEQI